MWFRLPLRLAVTTLVGLLLASAPVLWGAEPASADLVGHWKLAENAQDSGPAELHAENRGATFLPASGADDRPAAALDGRGARLQVPASSQLDLGTGDFSLSMWLHTDPAAGQNHGDLVSCYDPVARTGWHLALCTPPGPACGQSNVRQLQFGLDAATDPQWTDVGRPGEALLAFSLCVHQGELYAGTCEAGPRQVGHVYRYRGGTDWEDLGLPCQANTVSALATYRGELYAATCKYRLAGSALAESENVQPGGQIYRYLGDRQWEFRGQLPDRESIGGLAVYRDRLYATSLYKPAGFFRYDGGETWTELPSPAGRRAEALGVYQGMLWATCYDEGHVFRYDGADWEDLGPLADNTQTYSFAVRQGRMCIGTWPSGRVYEWTPENAWRDLGRLGEELEVMGMALYNGQLYAGTLPLAEVHRYDGDATWNNLGQLDRTPDVKYRRAWTMAQYQGRLFVSTLPSGHIHAMQVGHTVSWDHELPGGWQHITASRQGDTLRLFVNGALVAESESSGAPALNVNTDQPLVMGGGQGAPLAGRLADVRLYRREYKPEAQASESR